MEYRTVATSRIDLHTHTSFSDGTLSPEELVTRAADLGVQVVGITDHDTTAAVLPAQEAGRALGVAVVPGVEISAVEGQQELHILGYFVDIHAPQLEACLEQTREARWDRARGMANQLTRLGLDLPWDLVAQIAGESEAVGRQHIAQALLEAGHVATLDEAFELWIGRHGPAYVERFKLAPEEAVEQVVASGGLAALAHPYSYSRDGVCRRSLDLQMWLPRLRGAGLAGLEVYYPNYPSRIIRRLLGLARAHELVPTGGSDYHGLVHQELGSVSVPWALWRLLCNRYRRMLEGSARGGEEPAICSA